MKKIINWPNLVTFFRLFILFIIFSLLFSFSFEEIFNWKINDLWKKGNRFKWIFLCFLTIIAFLSDWVDGYLARKLSCITKLGQFLDPLVDKLLINTYFLFFSLKNLISPLFLIFFLIRDFIIESIRSYLLLKKNITLPADKIGKVKTFLQMLIIFLILLSPFFNNFLFLFLNDEIKISKILVIFFNIFLTNILFLSFYSGYFYFKKFIILLKEKN